MSVRNYAILWPKARSTGGSSFAGGNAIGSTEQHSVLGPEHTGFSGNADDVLHGDRTWGPGGTVNAPITAALSNPPTQAELETAIGSAASEVAGQAYWITDSDTGLEYAVVSTGGSFSFVPLVQPASNLVSLATAAGIFNDFHGRVAAAAYDPVSNKTFWTYINAAGDACIRSWDHATQTASAATVMRSALGSGDSHCQPGILIRSSDRKVLAFYAPHAGTPLYKWTSTSAADISAGSETTISGSVAGTDYTYPVPIELSDGIYLFLRTYTGTTPGGTFNHAGAIWSYSKSTDNGATWSAKTQVMSDATYGMYWLPSKTADGRVDFTACDRSTFDATGGSLFHMYMLAGGTFYDTDGTEITATKPFNSTAMTEVWASDGTQRADPGQIVLGTDGRPRALFFEMESVSPEDAHYLWARWDGASWTTAVEVAAAGSGSLTATCVLPTDAPHTVYYSKDVGGVAQVFRAETLDEGATWTHHQITDSANENALLVSVRDGAAELPVVWASKSGGWTRNDTVAADFLGASFVPVAGGQYQRVVGLDAAALGEFVFRRGSDGTWYASHDLGVTWEAIGAPTTSVPRLLTVDPGTPSYDDSGDDVEVTWSSKWGYGGSGPYYNSAGVTAGDEAILAINPATGELTVVPYNP